MEVVRAAFARLLRPVPGDRVVFALSAAVVTLAAVLTPSDAAVSVFGWEVPVSCTFRLLTGMPCPGCGLTRSFVYFAHGHVADAFRMNLLGPLGFVVTFAQVPLRAYRIWSARG